DPPRVHRRQAVHDGADDLDRLAPVDRPAAPEPRAHRLALEQFGDGEGEAADGADVVDGEDVRVRQRRDRLRLALEARERVGIGGQLRDEDLDGDVAIEPRIARAVDVAHPARAEVGEDFVRPETCAGRKRQRAIPAGLYPTEYSRVRGSHKIDARSMLGKTIHHYRIEATLGEGGMGVVYRAYDPKLERPVAIKVLLKSAIDSQAAVERFLREARASSALNHPNIVTVHEVGTTDEGD